MNHILNSMIGAKHVDENVFDEILMEFNDYLDNVALKHSDFSEFSPENSRVDEFFYKTMNTSKYRNLWKVIEMLLLLSLGQATVKKGFSTNKKVEVENMKLSYVSQRLAKIYEILRGSETAVIPEQEEKSLTSNEIQELKNKKRCWEKDIKTLIKSTDEFAEKAEENNGVTSIYKSNSLKRSAKAKEEKLLEITNAIKDLEKKIG
ncbi:hypothetical protein AVEN_248774-1 [Araneus ventricosus]|uniref:Uncharacterized protein n=1 Tax=Araneus ventricosus TaxID=182803 RepID=A0A4Y2IL30_ARAVE|nr:hypothetical protein AVEN_248774-1 [Araneus ventricosus]